jgi:AcrR family transcriptional regulator
MARSRTAMLAAARELLLREGPAAVTHQRVAQEAQVGRATAYRHWPRPDQLLLDAMAQVDIPFFREPVTPVRPWLRQQLRVAADEMALPAIAAIALAMMQGPAGSLPVTVRDRFTATVTGRIQAALTLAVAEGELGAPPDPHDAVALLVGPILHRTCMQGGTVSDELIDRLIDSIGTWHRPAWLLRDYDELAALGSARALELGQGVDRLRERHGPSEREVQLALHGGPGHFFEACDRAGGQVRHRAAGRRRRQRARRAPDRNPGLTRPATS